MRSAWLEAVAFGLWPSRAADRRRISELEAQLRLARCSKLNALLVLFAGDADKARLAAEITDRDGVIARLREKLEPFERRARDPKTMKFVKIRKAS